MKALFIGGYNHYTKNFAAKIVRNGNDIAIFNNENENVKLGFRYAKYVSEFQYISNVYQNFRKMCLDASNLLKCLTALVGNALQRANQYEELSFDRKYIPETAILRPEAFESICEVRLPDEALSGGVLCQVEIGKNEMDQFLHFSIWTGLLLQHMDTPARGKL